MTNTKFIKSYIIISLRNLTPNHYQNCPRSNFYFLPTGYGFKEWNASKGTTKWKTLRFSRKSIENPLEKSFLKKVEHPVEDLRGLLTGST